LPQRRRKGDPSTLIIFALFHKKTENLILWKAKNE
jgi:hypothetical protein